MSKGLNISKTMLSIRSVVAFDLETTGIPYQEKYTTKITELAMVACEREFCIGEKEVPRILHKIVLPVNPMKPISYGAYRVSGLSNDILESSKPFDANMVGLIRCFLERLPQPVCLVAHNGKSFDFPILNKQLMNCAESLPGTIYCADSVDAFKSIFPKCNKDGSTFGTAEEDAMCVEALIKLEKKLGAADPLSMNLRQVVNETTPNSKANPTNQLNYKNIDLNNVDVCRRLNLDDTVPVNGTSNNCKKQVDYPPTYRLRDVYKFLHNGNMFPEAHRAENDTLALLSCIVKSGGNFWEWLDNNAKLLSEIRPLR